MSVWTYKDLRDTVNYAVEEQGEPMELVVADSVTLLPCTGRLAPPARNR
jgi:hypothetical protein